MISFPTDPKKLKARIRSYERKLKIDWHDGYGKRYLLGPMYQLLGDLDATIKHYQWYQTTYPGDSGDPIQLLCWSLALFQIKRIEEAESKLKTTMFSNLYIIPYLLGYNINKHSIWHGCNLSEPEYIGYWPDKIFHLWNNKEKSWAEEFYNKLEIRKLRERWIEIHKELLIVRPGKKRSQLVEESFQMQHPGERYRDDETIENSISNIIQFPKKN